MAWPPFVLFVETQTPHKVLEKKFSNFISMEDSILYSSCFDANAGLFETLLGAEDAIISDALNHASIIDGVRLCKAQRYRYANNDMKDLEAQLIAAKMRVFALLQQMVYFQWMAHWPIYQLFVI